MTDQRTDGHAETSLDERVARALGSDDRDGVLDDPARRPGGPPPVDLRDAEVRPRRFGVRAEQDATRDRRLEQHELRLDALTTRLSGVALRLAALQAAAEGAQQAAAEGAQAARHDLSAELRALTARVDTLAADLLDVAATHELGTKVLTEARSAETSRVAELETAREEDRARLEALEAAVAVLTTKARAQAGQITKLRNQLKAATEADPAPPRASGGRGNSTAKRSAPRGSTGQAAGTTTRRRPS